MSFRGQQNQYSPYYQKFGVKQDGSGAASSTGNSYQSRPYSPLSAYQTRSQPTAQNATTSPSFYCESGYGNLASAGDPAAYDTRNGYREERSSVDTTNLGNLAYASSLSRTATSSQQGYTQGTSSHYGANATEATSGADGRPTSGLETDSSRRLPQTQKQYTSHNNNASTGRISPAQPRLSTITNPSYQPLRQYTPTQHNHERASSRNGQERNQAGSQGVSTPNSTPRYAAVQDTSLQSAGHVSLGGQSQRQPRRYSTDPQRASPLNGMNQPARAQRSSNGQQYDDPTAPRTLPHQSNIPSTQRPIHGSTPQTYHRSPPSTVAAQIKSPQSTSLQDHYPKTVDPSQVFDDIEYRRRKDEEMERRQSALAAQNTQAPALTDKHLSQNSQSEDTRLKATSPPSNDVLEAAASTMQGRKGSDSTTKDQMELEMKQMIEKMRDYKAKDPSLFSQIWEQVKKGQAPQASSTKPFPLSPTVTNGQLNSPLLSDDTPESEPSADLSFPSDFDRGRFPYQRRRRGGMISATYKNAKSHHKKPVASAELPSDDTPQEATTSGVAPMQAPHSTSQPDPAPLREENPSVPPQLSVPPPANTIPALSQTARVSGVPGAQMVSSQSDDTDQRLLAAMRTFHQSLSPPIPPARTNIPATYNERLPGPFNSASTPINNATPMTKPVQGRTNWPEDKKHALAESAVKFLKWNPANAQKPISAAEVHKLLDQNPSYTEVCETLTQRGFDIDRGQLARYLLNAVPDVGKPSAPGQAAKQPVPPAVPVLTGYNFQRPPSDRPMIGPQQVYVSGKVFQAPIVVPKPPTKEDKARKRNFSEIVHLTQELSEDEKIDHHQRLRSVENTQGLSVNSANMTIDPRDGRVIDTSHKTRQEDAPAGWEQISKEKVSEPMNKRRDARRCSSYDSKTIARDILISSGKHPTMDPLNQHLDILRERFGSVNHDTDLSTFKWDVVDPPVKSLDPPNKSLDLPEKSSETGARPAAFADIMEQTHNNSNEDDEDILNLVTNSVGRPGPRRRGRPGKQPPASRNANGNNKDLGADSDLQFEKIAPPRTERVASGPLMGKLKLHRDESYGTIGTQAYLIPQRFGFTPVATSTVPFSSEPVPTTHPLSKVLPTPGARCIRCRRQHSHCDSQKPCSRCKAASIDVDDCIFEKIARGNITPSSKKKPGSNDTPASTNTAGSYNPPRSNITPGSSSHRRGRPPGAKNRNPRSDKGIPKGPKAPSVLLSGRVGSNWLDRPASRRSSEARIATSPASSIAVVVPQLSPRVNDSEKQHRTKMNIQEVIRPVYRSYKCDWDQCPAELHNLETLRKHIRKHRKGAQAPMPCKMSGCAITDGHGGKTWLAFDNDETWDRHVKQKHIRMIARRQGDVLSGDSDEDLFLDE